MWVENSHVQRLSVSDQYSAKSAYLGFFQGTITFTLGTDMENMGSGELPFFLKHAGEESIGHLPFTCIFLTNFASIFCTKLGFMTSPHNQMIFPSLIGGLKWS
jgi:hypothetical protein